MLRKLILVLGTVITIALIFGRFVNLGIYPPGLSNDETEYAVSAKSYSLSGRDVSGYGLPLSLVKSETDGVIAPIPAVLSSPFAFGRQLSLAVARWPYAVANIMTALGVFFLVFHLTRNKLSAWISGIWFLLNPWSIYLSHNTADAPIALMFYLWGIIIFLKFSGRGLIISLILFTAGFFSYHGAKPLLFPLISGLSLYRWLWSENKLNFKQSFPLIIFGLTLTLAFIYAALNIPGAMPLGGDKTTALNPDKIAFTVNQARRQSLESTLSPWFVNKYSESVKVLAGKYLNTFSPAVLFVSGDQRATYHFGRHGLFYLLDFGLIILGSAFLYSRNRRAFLIILFLAALSPLSSVLSSVEFSVINRSFMLLPVMVVLSGLGLYSLSRRLFTFGIIVIVVIISNLNFWQWWRFQYPVQNSVNYWLPERAAARYMQLENPDRKIVYVTDEPWNELVRQIFYASHSDQIFYLKNSYPYSRTQSYQFKNLTISPVCPQEFKSDIVYLVKRGVKSCFDLPGAEFSIQDIRDSGDVFRIFNGNLCQGISGDFWRRFNLESDFNIEKLSPDQFCSRWVFSKS